MTAKSKRTSAQLPPGLSPAEEARWWDEHRAYWYTAGIEEVRHDPVPVRRTKPVNLRLPVDMIEALKLEAARRALPYQTLIRTWLKDRLNAEVEARSR